jgi:hypothetical protein
VHGQAPRCVVGGARAAEPLQGLLVREDVTELGPVLRRGATGAVPSAISSLRLDCACDQDLAIALVFAAELDPPPVRAADQLQPSPQPERPMRWAATDAPLPDQGLGRREREYAHI